MTPEIFTAERAEVLDGPEWLKRRRLVSAHHAVGLPMPTSREEEWRYSRVEGIHLERFDRAAPPSPGVVPPEVRELLASLGDSSGHAVTVDGVNVTSMGCSEAESAGVLFGPAESEEALGEPAAELDAFAAWNEALSDVPLVLEVPAGVEMGAPFVVAHHLSADGSAGFPRLHVGAGEGSRFAVVEVHTSSDVSALSVPVTQFALAPGSSVRHTIVQRLGDRVWQVGSVRAEVSQQATWRSGIAVLGGEYARTRIDCLLVGRGATGNVASAYLGSADRMVDLRTFQHHEAPDTTSDLYFKGALADESHSVYSGLIRIDPGAPGSNAVQANRVVKLSEHAWAESVPNLEIENNDVRCAHASAVGPVDPEQVFYLESRGVPRRTAERLIVGGFFRDALEHFPVPEVTDLVGGMLDAELDRRVATRGTL